MGPGEGPLPAARSCSGDKYIFCAASRPALPKRTAPLDFLVEYTCRPSPVGTLYCPAQHVWRGTTKTAILHIRRSKERTPLRLSYADWAPLHTKNMLLAESCVAIAPTPGSVAEALLPVGSERAPLPMLQAGSRWRSDSSCRLPGLSVS